MSSVSPYESPESDVAGPDKRKLFVWSAIFYFVVYAITNAMSWFMIMRENPSQDFNVLTKVLGAFIFPNLFVIPVFVILTIIRYPMVPGWYKNALRWSMFLCGILFIILGIVDVYLYLARNA